ncbi:MAG: hypothetical protein QME58_10945 [Bacteroidota bacterium]|nr:hypothetical protein [Bacteroidota bacterium]
MQVHFSGHITAPLPQKVSESELMARMPNEERGCFVYSVRVEFPDYDLEVTFKTEILINETLSNNEARRVEAHEKRHFEDFRRLVRELKENIESALENGHDHEIAKRLDWFDYDNCIARQRLHDEEGIIDYLPCIEPLSSRPM